MHDNLVKSKKYSYMFPHKKEQSIMSTLTDGVTIDDCFKQFMRHEKLSSQNAWYCNKCKKHKQAVKKIQIFKVPPVIVINLKRFKGHQSKQNTLVHFPLNGLDLSKYVMSTK